MTRELDNKGSICMKLYDLLAYTRVTFFVLVYFKIKKINKDMCVWGVSLGLCER